MIQSVINAVKEFAIQVRSLIWPKKYFAWQTLLMLSLFSWLVAIAIESIENEETLIVNFLTTLSWMFLTSAIWWALDQHKVKAWGFSISPWITGAVLCVFAFHPWESDRFRWALSSWPLISVAIAALPDFVNWELKFSLPKKNKQQQLVMILLVNLLLTSWILFYFRVQDWVNHYPSLLASSLNRSAFVYDLAPVRDNSNVQGVLLLQSTADAITDDLNGQPWYQTERWLYDRKDQLEAIAQRVNSNLNAPDERIFWQMAVPEPRRSGDGYLLTLLANWLGPVADNKRLEVEKTCKIMPEDRVRPTPNPSPAVSPAVSQSASAPAAKNIPPQTSKITVVNCGEDSPTVRWVEPGS